LVHLQRAGHKPYILVGGATGMVGDPSGKSKERNLLDEKTLNHNLSCMQKQLEQFLDFDCGKNSAEVVNNQDWFNNLSFLERIGFLIPQFMFKNLSFQIIPLSWFGYQSSDKK